MLLYIVILVNYSTSIASVVILYNYLVNIYNKAISKFSNISPTFLFLVRLEIEVLNSLAINIYSFLII